MRRLFTAVVVGLATGLLAVSTPALRRFTLPERDATRTVMSDSVRD